MLSTQRLPQALKSEYTVLTDYISPDGSFSGGHEVVVATYAVRDKLNIYGFDTDQALEAMVGVSIYARACADYKYYDWNNSEREAEIKSWGHFFGHPFRCYPALELYEIWKKFSLPTRMSEDKLFDLMCVIGQHELRNKDLGFDGGIVCSHGTSAYEHFNRVELLATLNKRLRQYQPSYDEIKLRDSDWKNLWVDDNTVPLLAYEKGKTGTNYVKVLGNTQFSGDQINIWVEKWHSVEIAMQQAFDEKRYEDALSLVMSAFPANIDLLSWHPDDSSLGYLLTDANFYNGQSNHSVMNLNEFAANYFTNLIHCYLHLNKIISAEKILRQFNVILNSEMKLTIQQEMQAFKHGDHITSADLVLKTTVKQMHHDYRVKLENLWCDDNTKIPLKSKVIGEVELTCDQMIAWYKLWGLVGHDFFKAFNEKRYEEALSLVLSALPEKISLFSWQPKESALGTLEVDRRQYTDSRSSHGSSSIVPVGGFIGNYFGNIICCFALSNQRSKAEMLLNNLGVLYKDEKEEFEKIIRTGQLPDEEKKQGVSYSPALFSQSGKEEAAAGAVVEERRVADAAYAPS